MVFPKYGSPRATFEVIKGPQRILVLNEHKLRNCWIRTSFWMDSNWGSVRSLKVKYSHPPDRKSRCRVIYKPRWDGFHDTPLESHLRSLSVTTAVIVGCNFPNCPRATAYGASMRDFRVALLRDAVSGVYPRGLAELNNISIDTPKTNAWTQQFSTS